MLNRIICAAAASFMLAAAFAPPPSFADPRTGPIVIADPWAATTNPGASVAAGYVALRNTGAQPDRLVSASSPRARRLELHEMSMADGVMRMRPVQGIDIPAGGETSLRPGGLHIMFMDIDAAFVSGERIPVTLQFERAGAIEVEFVARPRDAQRSSGHEH